MISKRAERVPAFTLIELLVVVAIIALLIAVLLPSLARARFQAKVASCGGQLRQVGIGVLAYANEQRGFIPRGPGSVHPFDFAGSSFATNQLWIGGPAPHPPQWTGAGALLESILRDRRIFYCPADDMFDPEIERLKIGGDADAYGSYYYRQCDNLPAGAELGQIDRLGTNLVDSQPVKVELLALDANALGEDDFRHTNHQSRRVNLLFRDGSVAAHENGADNALALSAEQMSDFAGLPRSIDQLLTNGDYAYAGRNASDAPRIEPPTRP